MHNLVALHLGVDQTYDSLKLRGNNRVGMKEDLNVFLSSVGVFGVSKVLRSDGGSQFSSDTDRLKYLLKCEHLIIVPYYPQGNSVAERRMKEVGAHLSALV